MGAFVLFLIRRSPGVLITASLLGCVSAGCTMLLVALVNALVDAPKPDYVPKFVVIALISAGCHAAGTILLSRRGAEIACEMRRSLARQIVQTPLRELEVLGTGPLFNALTGDINSVVQVFWMLGSVIPALVTVILLIGYIWVLSWKLFVWTLISLLVTLGLNQIHRIYFERLFRHVRDALDPMVESVRVLTGGAKELKLNRRRTDILLDDVLGRAFEDVREKTSRAQTFDAIGTPLQNLLTLLGIALALAFGRHFGVPLAALASYAVTIFAISGQLTTLVFSGITVVQGHVAISHVRRLGMSLTEKVETISHPPLLESPRENWSSVVLSGVTHAYHGEGGDQFVLGPIDIVIPQGEITFIVGGNGSGKSTLGKILTGLYQPESGHLRFGAETIRPDNLEWYRSHFSAIFANFMVFETLDGLGVGDVDERAQQYVRLLKLENTVKVKNGRLSSTHLSQGQMKRLALLASYLEDRAIYVFDEWAADQDPSFKAFFYNRLLPELKSAGKTVVVISHDDAYFGVADRTIKLDSGKVVAPDGASESVG